jgi:hypothetical protein
MPIAFSIAGAAQGLAIAVIYWYSWSNAILQLAALLFFLGAGWLTVSRSHPNRPRFRARDAAGILALGCGGVLVSAAGTYGGTLPIAQWWPGIALSATLVGIAPYCTPRRQLICALALLAFMGVVGWIVFSSQANFWPPTAIVFIAIGPVTIGAVSSVVFSYTVVARTLAVLDVAAPDGTPSSPAEQPADAPTSAVAQMSASVAPFLERVAAAGVVTAEDRALATALAERLRTDLVATIERSWLDIVAAQIGMIVSDPARLADSMNESQRTALRALLVAAMDSTVVDRMARRIELRAQPDGSTAVAISIDIDLPEGRRLVLLAPYYLTLKTTVEDLSWDDGRSVLMRFRIPPASPPT